MKGARGIAALHGLISRAAGTVPPFVPTLRRLIVILVVLLTGLSAGETMRTVSDRNEYGGITREITYCTNEEEAAVFTRILSFLDSRGMRVRLESYFTDASSKDSGVRKSVSHYTEDGKVTRRETYYTDETILGKGTDKMTEYFDGGGKKSRLEYSRTEVAAARDGVARTVIYLDGSGKMTRSEKYYTDKLAEETGTRKVTLYYDPGEKEVKIEYSYTAGAGEQGFDTMVIYLDGQGNEMKREYFRNSGLMQDPAR